MFSIQVLQAGGGALRRVPRRFASRRFCNRILLLYNHVLRIYYLMIINCSTSASTAINVRYRKLGFSSSH